MSQSYLIEKYCVDEGTRGQALTTCHYALSSGTRLTGSIFHAMDTATLFLKQVGRSEWRWSHDLLIALAVIYGNLG